MFRTLALALLFASAPLASRAAEPIRALLITGGCCHDYEAQKKIITEGISARANVTWDIVHEGGTSRVHKVSIYTNKDWARKYDVVVHNECFGQVNDLPFIDGIARAHYEGVAGVVLHCTMHSYRAAEPEEWRKFLGVTSVRHEKQRPLEVKNLKPEHPIMKGFPATWKMATNDELYQIVKLWENTVPLAQAFGQDTQQDHVCIWANTYGKARVFGTTLGHHNAIVQDEIYLDLVTRGLLWTCHKLDDNGKAKAGYAPKKAE